MKKKLLTLIYLSINLISCGQNKKVSNDEIRKETMTNIVKAFINKDSVTIYKLIDTTTSYHVIGKEMFKSNIDFISNELISNNISQSPFNFKPLEKVPAIAIGYSSDFFLKSGKFDSLYIKFYFNHYETSKIYDLDIAVHNRYKEIEKPFDIISIPSKKQEDN
ncbi:MAG: hypothetical protein JST29_12070 [Bacteroidetes bacterium]|nr:hypothetical protein [Bacteroidota bacterium]